MSIHYIKRQKLYVNYMPHIGLCTRALGQILDVEVQIEVGELEFQHQMI